MGIASGIGNIIGGVRGRRGAGQAYSNLQEGYAGLPDIPQYGGADFQAAQYQGVGDYVGPGAYQGAGFTPGEYAGGQAQADYVNQLQASLGIQGPADIRESQYANVNQRAQQALAGIDTGLASRGITGGGAGSAQNRKLVQETLLPAYAGIEGNYANQLSNFQNQQQQLANAYGQQTGQYGLGRGQLSQQAANAQNQYGLNAAQQANQFNLNEAQMANQFGLNQAAQANQFSQSEAQRQYASGLNDYQTQQQNLQDLYNAKLGKTASGVNAAQMVGGGVGDIANTIGQAAMMGAGGLNMGGAEQGQLGGGSFGQMSSQLLPLMYGGQK